MANLTGVTTNYFATAHETFVDNLSSSISAGAATVPITNLSEYTDGDVVALTVEPGTVNEATFIGEKASSPSRIINAVWTEGNTAVGHSNGATVIDYDSATHHAALVKGILQFATQAGALKTQAVRDALGLGASAVNGWEVLPYTLTVASGYNKGGKEFDITVANNDLTDELSAGMKLRMTRGTTPGTQCADLESGSSQYGSRASGSLTNITQTDDLTAEAWIKLESYTGSNMTMLSRYSGTGWGFRIVSNGSINFFGNGGASDEIQSWCAVPLNVWTHVAATLDMSGTTGTIYLNGISVDVTYTNGGSSSITQAGNLQIGALNGAEFFDGKIADVRLWSVVRTATQIRDNMCQQLVGTESNLVGYWKLNGDFNDSHANANHLTANGGAAATNVDNPFSATEYATIVAVTYSAPNTTITVHTGDRNTIPNTTITSPFYSVQEAPYNFPGGLGNNRVVAKTLRQNNYSTTSVATYVDPEGMNMTFNVPQGGRRVRLIFSTAWLQESSAAGNGLDVAFFEGSTQLLLATVTNTGSNFANPGFVTGDIFLPAGSHTIKLSIRQGSAGTYSIIAGVNSGAYIEAELI